MARMMSIQKKSGTTSRAEADFAATLTTAQASIARKGFQAMLPNGRTVATRDMPRQNNDFIRPLAGGALAFHAPVHGKTSPNSPFTRSELRRNARQWQRAELENVRWDPWARRHFGGDAGSLERACRVRPNPCQEHDKADGETSV